MKRECCRHPHASRGFAALIEVLVVMVLILGGFALYTSSMGGGKSDGVNDLLNESGTTTSGPADPSMPQSIPGKAIRKAVSAECRSNLQQLRMMVDSDKYENQDGSYPPNLESVPNTIQIRECPVSHKLYTYDPSTGRVTCTTTGHESF